MRRVRVLHFEHALARQRGHEAIDAAPDGDCMTIGEPTRNLEQNAAQWPVLQAFSEQLLWPVNGRMVTMTDEEWKDVLTAAFRQETTRLAMGLDGGVVMLGQRTRHFGKKEFSDWLDFLHATANERGVRVPEPKSKRRPDERSPSNGYAEHEMTA